MGCRPGVGTDARQDVDVSLSKRSAICCAGAAKGTLRNCRGGFMGISRLTTAYQCRFGESIVRRRYTDFFELLQSEAVTL